MNQAEIIQVKSELMQKTATIINPAKCETEKKIIQFDTLQVFCEIRTAKKVKLGETKNKISTDLD